MAEMIFYKFPAPIKAMFEVSGGVPSLKTAVYNVAYKGLNKVCAAYLDGFDESKSTNWLGLLKKPTDVEKIYLIDPAQAATWKKKFKEDQKRLKKNYKKIVEELKKKRLSPLALREAIRKELDKNPKLRHHVDNPIQEKEIEVAYNRYMEGQHIRFNETKAHKDLMRLKKAVENLRESFLVVKTTYPATQIDYDMAFNGLLNEANLLAEIEASIDVCEEGWANVIHTLTTGNASDGSSLSSAQAKRLVARWVGTLRRLRSKCLSLVNAINNASAKLSLSNSDMSAHITAVCEKERVKMNHREFMHWATNTISDSGTHILAEAYKANGYERQQWADDFFYPSERNEGFWAGRTESGTRQEKLDYALWFPHIGVKAPTTGGIDKNDFLLSSIAPIPKQKLFDIALSYVISPTNKEHTL